MAFLESEKEIFDLGRESEQEALIWQEHYPEYQRLADNDLLEDFDDILPEVNDGSLAAALFKLPKRIVNSDLKGRAKVEDRDEAWITELANIEWEDNIIPNANTQAPFHRKWKDAVRKAAIFGSVPLITLFVERGKYIGADFIVAEPQNVRLAPGAISDYDSDVFFWDGFYSKLKLMDMLERAKTEAAEAKKNKEEGYNKWNIPAIEKLLEEFPEETDMNVNKPQDSDHRIKAKGVKLTTVYQRGVDAPFYLYHSGSKTKLRTWTNPDPSGDVPVHFLYCYQDFVNPYGIGIAKLAGGTQNVLDLMRKSDVLATQLGFRPPISVGGDTTGLDIDSLVYAQDAIWEVGNARVERRDIANNIYQALPERMAMYQTSLQKMIPMGDTSISGSASGDPQQSKTPAGVKLQAANLSIDDEDFKDNLYMTYEAKARSMINTHFANMQGSDIRKLSDEQRELLKKAGLDFPLDENGDPTNELDVIWDNARASFSFEIEAEQDKAKDEEKRLEALLKVYEITQTNPQIAQILMQSGYKFDSGELLAEIISLTSDSEKILEQITPEDEQDMINREASMGITEDEMPMAQGTQQPMQQPQAMPQETVQEPVQEQAQDFPQDLVAQTSQEYGVDPSTAHFMLTAASQGFTDQEIMDAIQRNTGGQNVEGR